MRKFTILFLVVLFGLHWSSNAQTFTCPTTTTTWVVPPGVTSINVDAIGATGGRNSVDATPFAGFILVHRGGNGARVQATLAVTPGQVLNIYVGGAPAPAVIGTTTIGGFNGGGNSSFAPGAALTPNISGGGGGGASDIRIGGTALANRVIVAGGGGGAGGNYPTPPDDADKGGDGGGLTGQAGSDGGTVGTGFTGRGGTPAAGGAAGTPGGAAGALGVGGNGATSSAGGGGGGGYYGGGGAYWAGGGGGSSYTDAGIATAVTHTRGYNSSGCGSIVITVPCTAPAAISGVATTCVGATTSLSSTTAGGTWTSATLSVATVNSTTGVVTGVATGTSVISYTVAGGCYAVTTVTVTALPATGTITGNTTVCPTATTQLSDAVVGGVWSSVSPGVAAISATGLVTGVSAGTSTISYTVTSSCGTAAATTVVTVSPAPDAGTITGTTNVCPAATTQLSDAIAPGVWTSASPAVATVTATGLVTGVSYGTSVISYAVTNSCGVATATTTVTVNPPNPGTIIGMTNICPTTTTQLNSTVVGGVWSSVSPGVATISPTGLVTGVNTGTSLISYTVTNSCGTAAATIVVTVDPTDAGAIAGTTIVCPAATSQLTNTVGGGVWSTMSPGVAIISATGLLTGVSAGTATISYIITNSCGTLITTTVVTVKPLPAAGSITGPTTVCMPATISLTDGAAGGAWSSVPATIATVNSSGVVTGVAAGNATISYTVTNSCGIARAITNIIVRNATTAGTIRGGTKVCAGETLQLSNAIGGGQWGTTAAPIAEIDIATGLLTGLSEGVAGVTYLIPYCSFPYTAVNITVYSLPPTPVIMVDGATMSTTAGYAGYQWFRGGIAISGATDATYTATGNGTYWVTVTNEGDCTATSADKVISHLVGISNVNGGDIDIKVYPNPASTQLMISASEKIDISILGVDGKVLITQKDARQTDVGNLVPGLYFIKIYNKDGLLVKVATFVKG